MKTLWLSDVEEGLKDEVKKSFNSSKIMRNRLVAMLEGKIKSTHTKMRSDKGYNVAHWPLLQADSIGYERALVEVINLLKN